MIWSLVPAKWRRAIKIPLQEVGFMVAKRSRRGCGFHMEHLRVLHIFIFFHYRFNKLRGSFRNKSANIGGCRYSKSGPSHLGLIARICRQFVGIQKKDLTKLFFSRFIRKHQLLCSIFQCSKNTKLVSRNVAEIQEFNSQVF